MRTGLGKEAVQTMLEEGEKQVYRVIFIDWFVCIDCL